MNEENLKENENEKESEKLREQKMGCKEFLFDNYFMIGYIAWLIENMSQVSKILLLCQKSMYWLIFQF